jgi:hypothetical protein
MSIFLPELDFFNSFLFDNQRQRFNVPSINCIIRCFADSVNTTLVCFLSDEFSCFALSLFILTTGLVEDCFFAEIACSAFCACKPNLDEFGDYNRIFFLASLDIVVIMLI